MYSIVLAMALAPGNAAPAADIYDEIQDLKRSVAELREEQTQARVDELKLVIVELRQRITDDKLDELRRDLFMMGHAGFYHGHASFYHGGPMMNPMPPADRNLGRASVAVEIPTGASFTVNNHEIPVPPGRQTFYTPPLEPGKDYFYDCKVTVRSEGKEVVKVKRLKVRVGEVARLNFEDMEAR